MGRLPTSSTLVIDVPPKIWRPKPPNRYTLPDSTPNDVDEDLYLFPSYGRSALLRQTTNPYDFSINRPDRILWDPTHHQSEFDKVIKFSPDLEPDYRSRLTQIIHEHWDSFISTGVRRPVLNYEFCIDTGDANPIACKPPRYGVHESRIMQTQLDDLLALGWISRYPDLTSWLSMIVLAPKPHQEPVSDISDFIWRLCVSYRGLNSVTLVYNFPIPRCDDAIDNFAPGAGRLFWISVDAKSGFHQISVRHSDRHKLCFVGPHSVQCTFNVMPFGPVNAPACYTALMFLLRQEWQALFQSKFPDIDTTKIAVHLIRHGDRQIVDDVLPFSNDPYALILCFSCVCHIFTKWRLSFNPKKCDFFLDRVEWIGFDLRPHGNSPASSKYDLVRNWPLPSSGQSLHSFVGLLNFYARFIPHFETRVGPLRLLVRRFHRKPIPADAWTPSLTSLFNDLKQALTSDPLLRRYDSSLPTFIKTDWSKTAMSFILMQPEDSTAASSAISQLSAGDPSSVSFDKTLTSARLQPIYSASRRCSDSEADYHSFVGEIAAGRWAFSCVNQYLWGAHFYWICDCNGVSKIATYSGPSHQLRRWAQELLAYTWTTVHRNAAMMIDVDALNRGRYIDSLRSAKVNSCIIQCESFLASSLTQAHLASPAAFDPSLFPRYTTKCPSQPPDNPNQNPPPTPIPTLTSIPVTHFPSTSTCLHTEPVSTSSTQLLSSHSSPAWISINCSFGTFPAALHASIPLLRSSPLLLIEPSTSIHHTLPLLFPHATVSTAPISSCLSAFLNHTHADPTCSRFLSTNPSVLGLDWFCPHTDSTPANHWLRTATSSILSLSTSHNTTCAILFSHPSASANFSQILADTLPAAWLSHSLPLDPPSFGDPIAAARLCHILIHQPNAPQPESTFSELSTILQTFLRPSAGYGAFTIPTLPHTRIFQPNTHHLSSAISSVEPDASGPQILPSPTLPPRTYSPYHVAPEPFLRHSPSDPFGHSFGLVCYDSHPHLPIIRAAHPSEFAAFYNINSSFFPHLQRCLTPVLHLPLSSTLSLFLTSIPGCTATAIASALSPLLFSSLCPDTSPAENVLSCYTHSSLPPPSDWSSGCTTDPILEPIFSALTADPNHTFDESFLKSLPSSYSSPLRDRLINLHHGRLTYSQPLSATGRCLLLIIPPDSLRRRIFELLHSNPASGHLMAFKTLHRIRLRFYWHKMRSDIESWIKSCPDCILSNSSVRRNSELVYSWPISSPFAIIHVDVWQPGNITAYDGSKYVLGAMCDLTGFAIVTEFNTLDSVTLASAFMKHVLLRVGFCLLVAPDAGSTFKRHFEAMCKSLKLPCKPGLRHNHQSVSVERLFRFFNKAVTIAAAERLGDTKITVETIHVATYAWNASAIDGTDIVRSVPAVGRPFRFPIDCDLSTIPPFLSADTRVDNLFEFLRLGHTQSKFATEILRYLTEERRLNASHHANSSRRLVTYKPGDLVFATVQVQSSAYYDRVGKLSVRKRGPFVVSKALQHGAYEVRHLHSDTTETFHGQFLDLCPPSLWPCSPTDGPDQRFLNINVPPLPIALRRPLGCESYNHYFFDSSLQSTPPSSSASPTPASPLQDTNPAHDPNPTFEPDASLLPPPNNLHSAILSSSDKLFFIAYRTPQALRPNYALVQVDLSHSDTTASSTGTYYCHFLCPPSADKTLPVQHCRWWPIWHRYTTGKDGIIDYHERVEFKPNVTPDSSRYIAWADSISLSNPSSYLQGPFDFLDPATAADRSRTPSFRQFVPLTLWELLQHQCAARGIIPPALLPTNKAPTRRSRRKRQAP